MGNNASSVPNQSSSPVVAARYQSSTIPDTFFSDKVRVEMPPPYSTNGNGAKASDITELVFRSSDEQLLTLERKDITATTGALLPEDWISYSVIQMPESESILRTLFEFVGARRHPKLLNEKFERLSEIARAAEKYKIFSAMNICSERMLEFGDRHPKLVLLYAAQNDYPHIFDAVAPRVVTSENVDYLVPLLPERLRLPWLRYHARWATALTDISKYEAWWNLSSGNCWSACKQPILMELVIGVHALGDLDKIFTQTAAVHLGRCAVCTTACQSWKTKAENIIEGIGAFSEKFLDDPCIQVHS